MSVIQDIDFEALAVAKDQDVLRVVMNRPQVANAMNSVMGG